jgi:hypothetical protein
MIKKVLRSKIITTAGTFVRAEMDGEIVDEYASLMSAGVKFPPIVIFDTPEGLLLVDGFKRDAAHSENGMVEITADVRSGNRQSAIKFALGANTTHGERRSNADKRKAAEIALTEFPKLSNAALAEIAAVGDDLIADVRKAQHSESEGSSAEKPTKTHKSETSPSNKRIGRDGKERSMPQRSKPATTMPQRTKKAVTCDSTNLPLPPEILTFWNSAMEESHRLLTMVSELRTTLKKAEETNNPIFREVDFNDDLAKLDMLYADLKRTRPYAVCFSCNGVTATGAKNSCTDCKGRGFVSQYFYDVCIDSETKKVAGR